MNYTKINLSRGISLIDVIISTVIFLCLMGISTEIIYHSLKVSREENGLAFIRKEAIKGISWISKDIRRTHGASLSDCNSPATDVPIAISFLTTIGNDGTGSKPNINIASPQWESYVIYYLLADVNTGKKYFSLKRAISSPEKNSILKTDPEYAQVFDPNGFAFEFPLKFNDVKNIIEGKTPADNRPRVIARNISHLTLDQPIIEPSHCTITIETRDKNSRGGEIKAVETLTVFMRNTIMKIK